MSVDALQRILNEQGLRNLDRVYWNMSSPQLYEEAIRRREARLGHLGPLVTRTGYYTGRAANDKFIVDEPSSRDRIWWGKVNKPFSEQRFESLYTRACDFLEGKEVFVQDCLVGADPGNQMAVRVITQDAWHNLFARNMFIRPENFGRTIGVDEPRFTVLHVPHLHGVPSVDGTRSGAFIIINFGRRLILIGGTSYAGEIKKSVFSVMNYLLPQKGILTMHASANVGKNGELAIFFGLSGTGKTTLSADPARSLIGDDEHGWGKDGVFNLEGGCYAKVIHLSPEKEPLIYETTRMFGTILENVGMDQRHHHLDLDDASITENTRACYPITHIPNAIYPGIGGHAKDIIMLTCDAFGVLPPIARLSPDQAIYHFLSGYTAKVAGTEAGVTEPQVTFSTCFGAPFMSLHPTTYGNLLGERIRRHGVHCWLINTGWTGGPYGVGRRMDITHTRALLNAALDGILDDVPVTRDPLFQLDIPTRCPGVPEEILQPANTWSDADAYRRKARELAFAFEENFKQYADVVSPEVAAAGPRTDR